MEQARALEHRLRVRFEAYRKDAIRFGVLTVLLTPAFLALSVWLLLMAALYVDLPFIDQVGFAYSLAVGITVSLGFMASSLWLRPTSPWQGGDNKNSKLAAVWGCMGTLVALCHAEGWAANSPVTYWIVYGCVAIGMMSFLASAYAPHDHYYMGVWNGLMDDFLTTEDDIDRAHYMLGVVSAIPGMLMDSYIAIIGDRWLWKDLEEGTFPIAAQIMSAVSNETEFIPKTQLQDAPILPRGQALKMLIKMQFIRLNKGRLTLHSKGRDFLRSHR